MKRQLAAAVIATAALGALLVPSSAQAAGNTLIVDVGTVVQPVSHVAAGGLFGVSSSTTPTTESLLALRPKMFTQPPPRTTHQGNGATQVCCDALKVAGNITAAGAEQYIRMPDIYPTFPYQWQGWADWEAKIDLMVRDRLGATGTTNIAGWEIWNEPDGTWDTAKAGPYLDGWTRSYRRIRALDTKTPIIGPGYSYYDSSLMRAFMRHARDTGTLPQVAVWHELQDHSYNNVAAHVADYRQIERDLGISPREISINEYGSPNQVDIPSSNVHYMSVFERHGVHDAERAYWFEAGTFDGLFHNGRPTASYWAYKWYADQTGNIVRTTPQSWLDGVASYDSTRKIVNVVFGGDSGTNTVRVNGLGALGSSVRVTLSSTPGTGRFTNVDAPTTVSTQTLPVSNGSIAVPVSGMTAEQAYQLVVTPANGPTTSYQQTYEAENASVVNADTRSASGASNGSYVGGIDGSADMRDQSFVDFTVDVPQARDYTMTVRYANGTGAPATQGLAYNGGAFETVTYPATAGWAQFGSVDRTVRLKAGLNVVRLAKGSPNFGGGTGFAELDSITVR
ncbi:MAG: CBM35 domain-containing protein [Nocardioidaceae bacterium]|nr:CBM35 domain-containing protein [Nocardioidaceae bacterium]